MVSGNIDLIVLGMIALFLILRLRSILGRRDGFERPNQPPGQSAGQPAARQPPPMPRQMAPVIDGQAVNLAEPSGRKLPDPASPAGMGLLAIKRAEPSFEPARFLEGAEAAFRRIVGAYAAGDRASLQSLLTPDTYQAFAAAIAAREEAGETQISDIKSIHEITIEQAQLRPGPLGQMADIVVRFVSDQVNLVKDKDGNPITGTDAVTELVDLWGFERQPGNPDPSWHLASAQSA